MRQGTPSYLPRLVLGMAMLWPAVSLGVGEDDFWRDPAEYGNSQSVRFYRAIKGGQPLSPQEEQAIKDLTPTKDTDRYYVRIGYGLGRKMVNGISNQSNDPKLSGLNINQTSAATNETSLFIALGYVWESLRVDLEWLSTKNITYAPNPLFVNATTPQKLNANIASTTGLLNFYYDYRGFAEHIYPYVMLTVGGTEVRATTTITPVTTTANGTQNSFSMSYGAGVGIRFGIFSSLYLDLNARYIVLGLFNLKPQTQMSIQGRQSVSLLGIGAIWLF